MLRATGKKGEEGSLITLPWALVSGDNFVEIA